MCTLCDTYFPSIIHPHQNKMHGIGLLPLLVALLCCTSPCIVGSAQDRTDSASLVSIELFVAPNGTDPLNASSTFSRATCLNSSTPCASLTGAIQQALQVQQSLNASALNVTVHVAAGVYTADCVPSSSDGVGLYVPFSVFSLIGTSAEDVVFDCLYVGQFLTFNVTNVVVMEGVTVRNGVVYFFQNGPVAAGLTWNCAGNTSCSITLANCTFSNNSAYVGGAVLNLGGTSTPQVNHSVIVYGCNFVANDGGALNIVLSLLGQRHRHLIQ